ncbi:hypothetical protein B0H66DRAFT_171415 [Apodospora peruviana]|uniref:Uncharacterized protein n=1 Tax=Apodospora peruviana TaxID=516989 RepID=A0AAE0MBW8_9PEZI|nr:hypothetical protein B0H66DRAFT_171415 [Apodospora peruviana]
MAEFPYNRVSARCTWSPCVRQVAGYLDRNPWLQLSECQSMFGFPTVPTVTLSADPVFSTAIATSTYTDIIVTTSTVYSTLEQTSTSYANVFETATRFTTTLVNTVTTALPAPQKKRKHKKRGACKHQSSSIASSEPPSTSSSVPFSPNCPSLADYRSACACLDPKPVTEYVTPATSVIEQVESTTVSSTSQAVVTVAVTTVIVKPATTTLTTTLSTLTATTTTATQTPTPTRALPQNFNLALTGGPNDGLPAVLRNAQPVYTLGVGSGTPAPIGLLAPGTNPFLYGDSAGYDMKMWYKPSLSWYGTIIFATAQFVYQSAQNSVLLSPLCSLDPSTLVLSCSVKTASTPSSTLNRFVQCDPGSQIFMVPQGMQPSGCVEVQFKVSS